jgi:hypothetical protein
MRDTRIKRPETTCGISWAISYARDRLTWSSAAMSSAVRKRDDVTAGAAET